MGVIIKTATLNDLKKVQELNLKLFEKEKQEYDPFLDLKGVFSKKGTKYYKDKISKDSDCVFVAVINNTIVGYLCGGLAKTGSFGRLSSITVAEIQTFFVLEEFRSLGIGKKLYDEFIKWCKKKNVDKARIDVHSQNKSAIKFYKNKNFKDYYSTLEIDL